MSMFHDVREDEPFVRVDAEGNIVPDSNGIFSAKLTDYLHTIRSGSMSLPSEIADEPTPIAGTVPVGGSISGVIDFNGDIDRYSVNLVAGQTYLFSLQGSGATPINDSLLRIINPAFTSFVATDDDGGNGLYSFITYTATQTGTYTIQAQTFVNPDPDIGGYTIDVRQMGADAVGDTNATAGVLGLGTTFGFRETGTGGTPIDPALAGDVDRYAVNLVAGQFYTFNMAGGADYNTNPGAVPTGELDTFLILRDAAGNILAAGDDNNFPSDISSGIGFLAQTSGTYYIDATAYAGQTGGYALTMSQVDISGLSPLDSIDWRSADNVPFVDVGGVPTAYVYFAAAGESFGELNDAGDGPRESFGWSQHEMDAVMQALEQYEHILGTNYVVTTDVNQATFRLMTTTSEDFGAYFYPQDPGYGTQQGIGAFNVDSGGWGAFPQSLEQGGFSFGVILHEFGHAHGLAHPHDNGGGSDIMLGVTGAQGSLGIFDLNQGVYTVMSYNDAWQTHPDGPSSFTVAGIDNGWSGTLSAFDIAQLQTRYGVHDYNTGNTTYALTDVVNDAFYQTIWDTGGNDTISYAGALDARIDLTAATLDYSATGGGVVSFLHNIPGTAASAEVKGGFTIAHGVVIENATGGSGNDVLIGNSAANTITGNNGNDTLIGRGGNDILRGGAGVDTVVGGDGLDVATLGAGNDIFVAEIGATKMSTKAGTMSVDIITDFDSNGNDLIDLSGFDQAFSFKGTAANKKAGDLSYKTYDSINGAENALGIEIDGNPGASGVSGKVTVVFGNVDGGNPDFMIVLLGSANVAADDFIFGSASSSSSSSLIDSHATQGLGFNSLSEMSLIGSSKFDHHDLV